jgi:hypothetical protein
LTTVLSVPSIYDFWLPLWYLQTFLSKYTYNLDMKMINEWRFRDVKYIG